MSMQDPIADLLTRIRNAGAARHATCGISHSKVKERICKLLSAQGYLGATEVQGEGPAKTITVTLKYATDGRPVIRGIDRISKPGRRVYCGSAEVPKVLNGLGTSIISTSRGMVTDAEARRLNVGGEVICNVW
jgi:small subunit ribosomal protein S8